MSYGDTSGGGLEGLDLVHISRIDADDYTPKSSASIIVESFNEDAERQAWLSKVGLNQTVRLRDGVSHVPGSYIVSNKHTPHMVALNKLGHNIEAGSEEDGAWELALGGLVSGVVTDTLANYLDDYR